MADVPPPAALPSFINSSGPGLPQQQINPPTSLTSLPYAPPVSSVPVLSKPLPASVPPPISSAFTSTPVASINGNPPMLSTTSGQSGSPAPVSLMNPVAVRPPATIGFTSTAPATALPAVPGKTTSASITFPKQPESVSAPPLLLSSPAKITAASSNKKDGKPVTCQPKPPCPGSLEESVPQAEEEAAESGGRGWVGWLKGTVSTVGQRVAQKAKTSMDTMITTLDPQMKEFLHSGGDLDLVVASDKEVKVSPIREAFQHIFGKATVTGQAPGEAEGVACQPVGLEAAVAAAENRINSVRQSGTLQHPSLPVLAVENCVAELTPGCWYDIGVLLLDDPYHDVILQTFTQSTSIPQEWVEVMRAGTPPDYSGRGTGFAITIGQVAATNLQVERNAWHEAWCGVSRRDMLHATARSLASLYRARLPNQ